MDSQLITPEENQMIKPMDISEEIQSMLPMKRKADESSLVDSSVDMEDVGDGEGRDGEESDVSSRLEDQAWDYDSFEDGDGYKPTKKLDPNDEEAKKFRRYRLQMYQSNGFNIDKENYPGHVGYRDLCPIDLDRPFRSTGLTGRAHIQNMVDLALERYNRIKGLAVTCVSIVRAIICLIVGDKTYITFMARETPDGDPVEYQAKTEQLPWQRKVHVIFCRPAPKPKVIEVPKDEDLVSDSSDATSLESDQEWDVDSFDDESEYHPPDNYLEFTKEEIQSMRLYRRKMYPSKGFYVDGESFSARFLYFSPVDLDKVYYNYGCTGRETMQRMVDLALEKYNETKGSSVTCESIVRANLTMLTGDKLYITFMARESPGGDLVEYQAKTERKFWQGKIRVILCRPAPKS